jgi:hypothetical protein
MDPCSVELVFFELVVFAKQVDSHPLLPVKTDQLKRVIHELEFVLEDREEDSDESRDLAAYLACLDIASGGWHRS